MAGFQQIGSLYEIVSKIHNDELLLPAFQREYEWSAEQIERLFDSLMQGYPISSMLFWKVDKDNKDKWGFYKFLKYYREWYHIHNEIAFTPIINDFYAVLDGQQRLTSIYLALCGSYDYHKRYHSWDNIDRNFHMCDFYFNLSGLIEPENEGVEYEFLWIDKDVSNQQDIYIENNEKWFNCKKILEYKDFYSFSKFISELNLNEKETNNIIKFYELVFKTNEKSKINYYLEDSKDANRAVEIFTRINSGGTHLSYSDILFSYMIANCQKIKAREEVLNLVDFINQKLEFNISKDFILKTLLFLYSNDIKFKIDGFNKDFVNTIEDRWKQISDSIITSYELLQSFGLNRNNIKSYNAVLPIIYYIHHKNIGFERINQISFKSDKEIIKKYIFRSIILKPFDSSTDNVLTKVRKAFVSDLKDNKFLYDDLNSFPIESIEKTYQFSISDEYLNDILKYKKDKPETYAILSLLYPKPELVSYGFDKDHLHSISKCKEYENYKKKNDLGGYLKDEYDTLPNLQLLSPSENRSKGDKDLALWVEYECRDKSDNFKASFLRDHLIPDVNLDLENFEEFFERRKELLIAKLKEIL